MKLSELSENIRIDPRKLTEYALNPDSQRGRDKAHLFLSLLGYSLQNYRELMIQIERLAPDSEIEYRAHNGFGELYRADFEIQGTSRQTAILRTGWFLPDEVDEVRLTTLWVLRTSG